MSRLGTALVAAGVGAAGLIAAHALPAITSLPALRRAALPRLAGVGAPGRVALTFDDGPDPVSTPRFLDELHRRRIRATFFLLGRMVERSPDLARRIRDDGHEIALHGYDHRCLLLRGPGETYRDLARGADVIADATGTRPTLFRPPYGVLSTAALVATARLQLRPVLWTAWGRDWSAHATGDSVARLVIAQLRGGGTILLHDSDCTSAPGAWRSTLAALPVLLEHCQSREWTVGPLGEHEADRG